MWCAGGGTCNDSKSEIENPSSKSSWVFFYIPLHPDTIRLSWIKKGHNLQASHLQIHTMAVEQSKGYFSQKIVSGEELSSTNAIRMLRRNYCPSFSFFFFLLSIFIELLFTLIFLSKLFFGLQIKLGEFEKLKNWAAKTFQEIMLLTNRFLDDDERKI